MTQITINPRQLVTLYTERKYDELADRFLEVLAFLDVSPYFALTAENSFFINVFCDAFLFLFPKEDFALAPRQALQFINYNPVICNIVAISPFGNTDAQLEILRKQQNNLIKILTLLSPRNGVRFEVRQLFDTNPHLASFWYGKYFESVEGFPTELVHENIKRHQAEVDERWVIADKATGSNTFAYSFSTYVDPVSDRKIKEHINRRIRPVVGGVAISNTPNPRRIAIVTARWARTSAVYRSCARFVEALRPHYDLTLIQLLQPHDDFDRSLFSDIRNVRLTGNLLGLAPILENDFALAYFPDIGMQEDDRYVANVRFAPIQIMGYGHPVSTFGADIDYFLGGQAVERIDLADTNYSERLVLIPGIGAVPTHPDYELQGVKKQRDAIVINCPWGAHKCNYAHLLTLRRVLENAGRPVLFRFFVGAGLSRHNSFIPFERDMRSVLGTDNVEVIAERPYREYMAMMEGGDFAIDSFPFGGFNTIIDQLWLGKPVVTLEGTQFINRASSALLRQVGLEELVTHDNEEYAARVLRLIQEEAYRKKLCKKIRGIDLEAKVFDPDYPRWFRKAVDYLIANHAKLKAQRSRAPIIIK